MSIFSDPSFSPIVGMFPALFLFVFPFLRLAKHWNQELATVEKSIKFKYILTIGYLVWISVPAVRTALYFLFHHDATIAQLLAKGTDRFSSGRVFLLFLIDTLLGVSVYILGSGIAAFNKTLTFNFLKIAPILLVFNCINFMLTFMFIDREKFNKISDDNILFVIGTVVTFFIVIVPLSLIIKFLRSQNLSSDAK